MKTKRFLLAAGIVLAMAFTFSCSDGEDDSGSNGGGYTGPYEQPVTVGGKEYKTVKIGNQTWMAENLNYDPGTGNSACYGNQPSNCASYGRLYDWPTAMAACPSGWHLPSDADWDNLITVAGGEETAGAKLKSTSGWNGHGGYNGTNDYGFSALPSGSGLSDGSFAYVGGESVWWSASEYDSDQAYIRFIYDDKEYAKKANEHKSILHSVRCLKGGSSN